MKVRLPSIQHDLSGFEKLVLLYAQTKDCHLEEIEIDMGAATWFSADMCAAFGAILYHLGKRANTVHLSNIERKVDEILSKNGFFSHYGRRGIPDQWGTTIAYQRFGIDHSRVFASYIMRELLGRREIPRMSQGLQKKFHNSLFEVFNNAVSHSGTPTIFSCGQFFPKENGLSFIMADLGTGIKENIKTHLGLDLSPEEAIDWATKKYNTTRQGEVPGGLGLTLLCEFIDLNGGCIQIVSDAGYWRRSEKETTVKPLDYPFPGTVTSLDINTADQSAYALSSELDSENFF